MDKNLDELRSQVRQCDTKVLETLKKRFQLCLQIKKAKNNLSMDTYQPEVEKKLKDLWLSAADDLLSEEFLNELMSLVLTYSKQVQDK